MDRLVGSWAATIVALAGMMAGCGAPQQGEPAPLEVRSVDRGAAAEGHSSSAGADPSAAPGERPADGSVGGTTTPPAAGQPPAGGPAPATPYAGGGTYPVAGGEAAPSAASEPWEDPFDVAPRDAQGLTNTSADLWTLLEEGTLRGACDRYEAAPDDERAKLLCGKEMFFYETYGTAGVPRAFVDVLLDQFADIVGDGFSEYGMVPDPTSEAGYPLGLTEGDRGDVVFTCASCHFGRMLDGRYAVGSPNHDYEYGKMNLAFLLPLMRMMRMVFPIDPSAEDAIRPILDRLDARPDIAVQLGFGALGAVGNGIPEFPPETQAHYASWKPGTMDFFIQPLPVDDGVHTVSRIPPLWQIPTRAEEEAAGMPHAMLGWTGNTRSVENFLDHFVSTGGGDVAAWPAERLAPLAAYIRSLDAPSTPPGWISEARADRGAEVFVEQGCDDCHGGPSGSGTRIFSFDEIGTDAEIGRWADPDGDLEPCCGLEMGDDQLTGGIKAPRLLGLWSQQRFLHNGAVESLEELLCAHGGRDLIDTPAFDNWGHFFGCDGVTPMDKLALLEFLRSH